MASPREQLSVNMLAGAQELLAMHARELPQRDDLCGAFCGALALGAAGIGARDGEPLDQDAVALAAGSVVSREAVPEILPAGERGRRDYRVALPMVARSDTSGTTAAGLVRALAEVSQGRVAAIPLAGPWTARTLAGIFDAALELERAVTLIANVATHHLWGSRAGLQQMLGQLLEGSLEGPEPDWDVGHFACVVARVNGPCGTLYAIADTYPSLGSGGVHMQPQELLARALDRRDMPAGGMLAVVCEQDAEQMRARVSEVGLREQIWDNGTAGAEAAA